MHKLLKEKYLKESGFGGTLTSLLTVLVKTFFPEMQANHFPEHGWDTRRQSYINQPCFNLDFDVLRQIAVDEPLPSINKPNAFIANTDNFADKKPDNDTDHTTITPMAVRKSCVEVLKMCRTTCTASVM
ncbi:hypothetical protein ACF0H5_001173 [Mactra antiquata]